MIKFPGFCVDEIEKMWQIICYYVLKTVINLKSGNFDDIY